LAFSYWIDKPWFLTEGKLITVLIIPSSWGSQLDGDLHQHTATNKNFSGAVAGERRRRSFHVNYIFPRQLRASKEFFWRRCRGKRRLLQGKFRTHILYFVLVLLLLYFCLHHFIKSTKKLVSFIVIISLLLVHFVVS
jgi:hypothetical protein